MHISEKELECRCGCGQMIVNIPLVAGIEAMRARFLRPVFFLSGNRCQKHNANVGGVGDSQHLHGRAADIYFEDIDVWSIKKAAQMAGFVRIGVYPNSNPPFVHVDTGNYYGSEPAEWEG
jgi:uncharacterized protein YcbK (DUF882 family)